jgi:hypothetical protein
MKYLWTREGTGYNCLKCGAVADYDSEGMVYHPHDCKSDVMPLTEAQIEAAARKLCFSSAQVKLSCPCRSTFWPLARKEGHPRAKFQGIVKGLQNGRAERAASLLWLLPILRL